MQMILNARTFTPSACRRTVPPRVLLDSDPKLQFEKGNLGSVRAHGSIMRTGPSLVQMAVKGRLAVRAQAHLGLERGRG